MIIAPNMKTGMKRTVTRKALVRTMARYSRRAIVLVLRICGFLLNPCVRPGDPHEDIVQRGPRQLKVLDPRPPRQLRQDVLRIGALRNSQFLKSAVIIDADDAGQP